MAKARRECQGDRLYPVQINSIKEIINRGKGLKEAKKEVGERLKKEVEEGEKMERDIEKIYYTRAMECVKREVKVVIKYLGVIAMA